MVRLTFSVHQLEGKLLFAESFNIARKLKNIINQNVYYVRVIVKKF